MVSVYAKALLITLVIFTGNFFFVKYLDDTRAADLRAQLDRANDDLQASRILLLYGQAYGGPAPEICPLLENRTSEQVNRLYDLLLELQKASEANVFTDVAPIKTRYILSNAELYLYAAQLKNTCGTSRMEPVLYFYPDKRDCIECRAQAEILDGLRDDCGNIRVFAFPTDLGIGVVDALKTRYSIESTPAIVVGNAAFSGVTSRERILALAPCVAQ